MQQHSEFRASALRHSDEEALRLALAASVELAEEETRRKAAQKEAEFGLFVKPEGEGEKFALDVKFLDTIEVVKAKIQSYPQRKRHYQVTQGSQPYMLSFGPYEAGVHERSYTIVKSGAQMHAGHRRARVSESGSVARA